MAINYNSLPETQLMRKPARELSTSLVLHAGGVATGITAADIMNWTVDVSAPQGKFFGFALSHKATVTLRGTNWKSRFTTGSYFKINVMVEGNALNSLPYFYPKTIVEDVDNNKTVITAYDAMDKFDNLFISDLFVSYPVTLYDYAVTIAQKTAGGSPDVRFDPDNSPFNVINPVYTEQVPPNFGGTESLRSALAAIAEVTGSICFIKDNVPVFRRIQRTTQDTVTGANYFKFTHQNGKTLTQVAASNELGDSVIAGSAGVQQVLWENPFLSLRTDRQDLVTLLLGQVSGITLIPFSLDWRGSNLYYPGDYVKVQDTKTGYYNIYSLSCSYRFDGGLRVTHEWSDSLTEETVDGAPTSIGATLKRTSAKVDKVNNRIELIAAETQDLQEQASELILTSQGIYANVQDLTTNLNDNMTELSKQVQTALTADNFSIAVQKELAEGVNTIKTTTGFTFDNEGLTVSKSGSEMTTQITEDGMKVFRDDVEVLTANNVGVTATNLHARTYLIIGNNSRFEDYTSETGYPRTACFWIE